MISDSLAECTSGPRQYLRDMWPHRQRVRSARTKKKENPLKKWSVTNLATPTYPLLQQIPLRLWIIEDATLQINADLTEEVIASKHVRVPHGEPQGARLQAGNGRVEAQCLIEDRIECVFLDFGLAFARLRLVGQQINL